MVAIDHDHTRARLSQEGSDLRAGHQRLGRHGREAEPGLGRQSEGGKLPAESPIPPDQPREISRHEFHQNAVKDRIIGHRRESG